MSDRGSFSREWASIYHPNPSDYRHREGRRGDKVAIIASEDDGGECWLQVHPLTKDGALCEMILRADAASFDATKVLADKVLDHMDALAALGIDFPTYQFRMKQGDSFSA